MSSKLHGPKWLYKYSRLDTKVFNEVLKTDMAMVAIAWEPWHGSRGMGAVVWESLSGYSPHPW
jgi:hypothetical protein